MLKISVLLKIDNDFILNIDDDIIEYACHKCAERKTKDTTILLL